ncbi:unnamed protein product [Anisakis simplex]|uniref:Uncharacterized protein n=1 Tax=Anisakis simplex TaxID=6269 RepID=A0A0M3K625_ANISI|nr:unnamed protein product [Anisakis simplex]
MLQVLTVLQIIPATCRFADYCWATWHVMARRAGPLNKKQIDEMERTGAIPDKLTDAFCRAGSVLLLVHPLFSGAPVKVFGRPGEKVLEAAEYLGTYAVLDMPETAAAESTPETTKTPLPTITEEEEDLPGPSSRPDFPIPNIVLTTPNNHNYNLNDGSPQLIDSPTTSPSSPSSSSSSSPNSPTNTTTRCRYNFRNPRREVTPLTPRINPEFEAANTSSLTPQHAAELADTIPPPYKIASCRAAPGAPRHLPPWPPGKYTSGGRNVTILTVRFRNLLYLVRAHGQGARRPLGEATNNSNGCTPRREVCISTEEGDGGPKRYRRASPGVGSRWHIHRAAWSNLGDPGPGEEEKKNDLTPRLMEI